MRLEQLTITRVMWGAREGQYEGKIKYTNEYGSIDLALTHDVSMKLLGIVADSMIESSKQIARELTASVIDCLPETVVPKLE